MINKSEWMDWKNSQVTEQLVEAIRLGKTVAIEELVASRGEVGDFHRGANFAFEDILNTIQTGYGIYEVAE